MEEPIDQLVALSALNILRTALPDGSFREQVSGHGTLTEIRLEPARKGAATVVVIVFFDGTFQIAVEKLFESEQSEPLGDIDASAQAVCEAVLSLASAGLVSVRRWGWLGPLSPRQTGSPKSPVIRNLIDRPSSRIVAKRLPWY